MTADLLVAAWCWFWDWGFFGVCACGRNWRVCRLFKPACVACRLCGRGCAVWCFGDVIEGVELWPTMSVGKFLKSI